MTVLTSVLTSDRMTQMAGVDVLAVIGAARLAATTRRNYAAAVGGYLETGGHPFDAAALAAYAAGLSDGARRHLRAAVGVYANAVKQQLNAAADPLGADVVEVEARTAQASRRLDALQNAVEVRASRGQKTHTWLSQAQVKTLLDGCGNDLKGERDRLALGLLVCAGLRREEAVNLTFGDVALQPANGRLRTVLAIDGKGGRRRTVPISDALANAIERWGRRVGHQGRVLRSIDQRGDLRESMSGVALFQVVQERGAAMGKPDLAPHDLRRTYAQLGYEAGVPITQISTLLGHSSVATTQLYLSLDLDRETTVSDFIPFGVGNAH